MSIAFLREFAPTGERSTSNYDGVVVAEGTFARRGTCRDPDQSITNCEAPGRIA